MGVRIQLLIALFLLAGLFSAVAILAINYSVS